MNEHKAFSYDCRNMKANEELSGTLQAKNEGGFSLNFINPVCVQNTGQGWWNQGDVAQTLRTPCGGDSVKANLIVYDAYQHHGWRENDRVGTLTTDNNSTVRGDTPLIRHRTVEGGTQLDDITTDQTAVCIGNGQTNNISMKPIANTLDTMDDQQKVLIPENTRERKYIVRRLTPLECCRLQGFPDWWTDGVDGSDSAQYKMWGNGIALPCAVDVLRRIAEAVE